MGIAGEVQVKFLNGPKHIHRVGAPLCSARAFFEVLSLSFFLINILLILRVPQLRAWLGQLTNSFLKLSNSFTDLGHILDVLGQLLSYLHNCNLSKNLSN